MRKHIAALMAVWALFCFLPLTAAAQAEEDAISLRINSNIAGCTRADAEKLLEIRSRQVQYYDENGYSVFIADCAGGGEYAHMDAGRTYYITYTLTAADGYTLPASLSDGDVLPECGKGVSKVNCTIIELQNVDSSAAPDEAKITRALRITARVVVDGSPFQRLIGLLRDLLLKFRAWSLY